MENKANIQNPNVKSSNVLRPSRSYFHQMIVRESITKPWKKN